MLLILARRRHENCELFGVYKRVFAYLDAPQARKFLAFRGIKGGSEMRLPIGWHLFCASRALELEISSAEMNSRLCNS